MTETSVKWLQNGGPDNNGVDNHDGSNQNISLMINKSGHSKSMVAVITETTKAGCIDTFYDNSYSGNSSSKKKKKTFTKSGDKNS